MAPHLPREFLANLIAEPCMKDKRSFIFSKEFQTFRFKFANHNQTSLNAESNVANFQGGFFRTIDEGRRGAASKSNRKQLSARRRQPGSEKELYEEYGFLHMAIDNADPPLACEMIRHGTLIDKENAKGQTPLLQALERIWDLHSVLKGKANMPLTPEALGYTESIETAQRRVRYIAVVLIGQHANVNATVRWQGQLVSSLHFACAIEDWYLVALLLNHGAHSMPTPSCVDAATFLATAAAKRRLTGLKANAKKNRPPRLCPCFSGNSKSGCHSEPLPYPDNFTCSCGSTKVYGKCCKTRNIPLTEIWDKETKWIRPSRSVFLPGAPSYASPVIHAGMEQVRQNGDMERVMHMVPQMMFNPDIQSVYTECLEIGLQDDALVDPAFRFAYFEIKYFPTPQGRTSSKHWCRQKQKEWNAAVDNYIDSDVDTRPRSAIEAAAKIGVSLGAMFNACEADGCDKVEGRDIEKVLTCSRCKVAFYCSPTCQKLHWRTHKPLCGSVDQTERPLPSQVKLTDFVCKYSPGLMKYRIEEGSIEGLNFNQFARALNKELD
ncbi:hypothetical protein B0H19DRAFT_1108411 [Mycena capillaripes]|nr:hypothetical protein B0H19DRAFT_1108411 [Mycena capillaripes]